MKAEVGTGPALTVRPATAADVERISVLAKVVWINTYAKDGITEAFSRYVESAFSSQALLSELQTNSVVVAEREQNLLGYALLNPATDELGTLYVLPKVHGQGVGTALVRYCQELCAGALWLTCWEGNKGALAFYRRLQFADCGEDYFVLEGSRYRNIKLILGPTSA
ncbi:N-acetyltransferase family protein [Gilvimarinus sp. F26214L]|uniref:GNAT family N-acetyltransferase n=1 Tax=Gilvimarinus sp. DZF01 TaxID=3461371 RepID=UPI004045766C